MEVRLAPVYINGRRYLPVEEDETLETIVNAVDQLRRNRERARARYQANQKGQGRKTGIVLHIEKQPVVPPFPQNDIIRQDGITRGTPVLPVPIRQGRLCPLPQPCNNPCPSIPIGTNR